MQRRASLHRSIAFYRGFGMNALAPTPVTVAAFYHFASLDALEERRATLMDVCDKRRVRGTVLLAREGVNGTIAGEKRAVLDVLSHLRALNGFTDLAWKESQAEAMPFNRMKVRIKREIVTMGRDDVDPAARVGRYIEPQDWNDLADREDVVLIDTRNDYEVGIGTFEGAIDPNTKSFRDFPEWWKDNAGRFEGKTVAMFCTGGIRCEKATSWLVGQGVEDVVHLKGGILKYLEDVPESESRWSGECFVFDQRVSVSHGLRRGTYDTCHACRRPVSPDSFSASEYEHGVSCPACIGEFTEEDRARFRERQRQVDLAAHRGERHLAGE